MLNAVQRGSLEYKNMKYIYDTIDSCSKLINILSQNMDEFPDQKYEDLYALTEGLIKLKWSAVEILGGRK